MGVCGREKGYSRLPKIVQYLFPRSFSLHHLGFVSNERLVSSDGEGCPFLKFHVFSIFELDGTNLRSLCIQQDSAHTASLRAHTLDVADHFTVVLVGAVRKVKSSNVHSSLKESFDLVRRLRSLCFGTSKSVIVAGCMRLCSCVWILVCVRAHVSA